MLRISNYILKCKETFNDRPLSEGDGLVFSSAAYAEFAGSGVTLPAMIKDFIGHPVHNSGLFYLCQYSERYSSSIVLKQKTVFDSKDHCQFSGTAFLFNTNCIFIAFRGTDESVAGWLEDFDIIYKHELLSQKLGLIFLEDVANLYPNAEIYLGGHSKGGNIAEYASAFCNRNIQKRIKKVYSYDGPGFIPELRYRKEFIENLQKVEKYVPQMSFFGMILLGSDPVIPVKNHGLWFVQHDYNSWYIEIDGHLNVKKHLKWAAKKTKYVFQRIISSLSKEERKLFGQIAEKALTYGEVKSMYQMSLRSLLRVIGYLSFLKEKRERKFARWLLREVIFGFLAPVRDQ